MRAGREGAESGRLRRMAKKRGCGSERESWISKRRRIYLPSPAAILPTQTASHFFNDPPLEPERPPTPSDVAYDAGNCGEELFTAELPTPLRDIEQEDGYLSPLPPSSPCAVTESDLASSPLIKRAAALSKPTSDSGRQGWKT